MNLCNATRTLVAMALAATFAGCGGGGSDAATDTDVRNVSPQPDQPASDSGTAQPVASTLIDKLFLADSPSGFYQFGKGESLKQDDGTYVEGTPMVRSYIDFSSDHLIKQVKTLIAGAFDEQIISLWGFTVITEDGGVHYLRRTLFEDAPKVFDQTPTTLDIGSERMTSPLYRVKFVVRDISGKAINSEVVDEMVVSDLMPDRPVPSDSEPQNAGVPATLKNDTSSMPQGSEAYGFQYTALKTYLTISTDVGMGGDSLEALQADYGGSIESLGKYRYLKNTSMPHNRRCNAVIIDMDSANMPGCLVKAGEIAGEWEPRGYNRTAADFIASRLEKALPSPVAH